MENRYDFPLFHWHLEISSKCTLACSRCPRTGPENRHKYTVTQHSLEFIQKTFSVSFIKNAMKRVLLCGGQGDPIYNTEIIPIVRYFKTSNPEMKISIVTNGSYKTKEWWASLASELNENDDVVFSVDGWDQESNAIYRVNSDFKSILIGMQEMVKSSARIHWSTIVFKFNENKIEHIKNLARELGINYFHRVHSTKFDGPWMDATGVDPLKPSDEYMSQETNYLKNIETLNSKGLAENAYIKEINNRFGEHSKKQGVKPIMPRCMTGERGLYLDASGILFPCSWISHPHDSIFPKASENFFIKNKELISLANRSLIEVINDSIWEEFFQTWENKKSLYSECGNKCGAIKKNAFENMKIE